MKSAPSRRHWKLTPLRAEEKENVADCSRVIAAGTLVKTGFGDGVAVGGGAGFAWAANKPAHRLPDSRTSRARAPLALRDVTISAPPFRGSGTGNGSEGAEAGALRRVGRVSC